MKLEGIDPEHPSRYCVLTVVEVVGKFVLISFFFYICYIKINLTYLNYIFDIFRLPNTFTFRWIFRKL